MTTARATLGYALCYDTYKERGVETVFMVCMPDLKTGPCGEDGSQVFWWAEAEGGKFHAQEFPPALHVNEFPSAQAAYDALKAASEYIDGTNVKFYSVGVEFYSAEGHETCINSDTIDFEEMLS